MTQELIRALAKKELSQVILRAQDELKAKAERRRLETIAKIKALAGTAELSITINGRRGRPVKVKPRSGIAKAGKA